MDDIEYFELNDFDPMAENAVEIGAEMEQESVGISDYTDEDLDIVPGADPNILSEAHNIMKANSLLQKLGAGLPLNVEEVTKRVLLAENQEDIEDLMEVPDPQPDPEFVLKQDELDHKKRYEWAQLQLKAATSEYDAFKDFASAVKALTDAQATETGIERDNIDALLTAVQNRHDMVVNDLQQINGFAQQQQPATEVPGETPTEGMV